MTAYYQLLVHIFVIALIIQGSQSGSLDGKSLPEPPTSNYYVGFSCLDTKYSFEGRGSCGAYFQELIKTFEDGFPRPHVEEGKV